MNKKIIIIIIVLAVVAFAVGIILGTKTGNKQNSKQSKVFNEIENDETKNVIEKIVKKYTAEEIIYELKDSYSLPIDNIIVYTEENDPNSLLGRPNQYTSKVNFADSRLEQYDEENPVGGSIEVFNNEDDMQKRKEYIESLGSAMSMLVEYDYSNKYILLRLSKEMTPTQADEYKQAFDNIMK